MENRAPGETDANDRVSRADAIARIVKVGREIGGCPPGNQQQASRHWSSLMLSYIAYGPTGAFGENSPPGTGVR